MFGPSLFGARARKIYYNGRLWIRVKQRGGYWDDKPSWTFEYWTNVVPGFGQIPVCIFRK